MQKFACKVCYRPTITLHLLQVHILRHMVEDRGLRLVYDSPENYNFLWNIGIFDQFVNQIIRIAKHRYNSHNIFFVWDIHVGSTIYTPDETFAHFSSLVKNIDSVFKTYV